jgi:hypothetical protein
VTIRSLRARERETTLNELPNELPERDPFQIVVQAEYVTQ